MTAVLLLAGAPATASATTVSFEFGTYVAPVGAQFSDPLRVTVKDDAGEPLADTPVSFVVTPDFNGASASLSAPTATTNADGVAQVTATAGDLGGYPVVRAAVGDASARAGLVLRPPGYRPGEELASIVAEDQNGQMSDVRDLLGAPRYTLIDICEAWCEPCRAFAQNVEQAIQQLGARGIRLQLASLLRGDVSGQPSTQADAQEWKQSLGLTGSVFHADGSTQSELYRAAGFFIAEDGHQGGAFPTHLLVRPDGTIVDRVVGNTSVEDIVTRVVQATGRRRFAEPGPPSHALGPAGEVAVQLPSGEAFSELFEEFGIRSRPEGAVFLNDGGTSSATTRRNFGFFEELAGEYLPPSGRLGLSLTRFRSEKSGKVPGPDVPVTLKADTGNFEDDGYLAVAVDTRLPVSSRAGTTSVEVDLSAVREVMRTKLESGDFTVLSSRRPEPGDFPALLAGLFGVEVQAAFPVR